ncbi:hypothetical protein KVV02_005288 [Mortierella alpina]|uniref:Uncharacterized protein n=1 Tax=Mortierella alpina TaxID=64518 RepID=A0A9P8A1M3_MORAP|nr:hypothetical protein KVV02_005288 [Mortierella alpina]
MTIFWSHDRYILLVIVSAILLFLYIARDYPQWKAHRQVQHPHTLATSEKPTDSAPTTIPPNSKATSSTWPSKFSIRWIPYLPFAFVYLVIKAAWAGLRQLVLHSILAAENSSVHLVAGLEAVVHWCFLHGPDFIRTAVLTPLQSAALQAWHSPAATWAKVTFEEIVIPGIVRTAETTLQVTKEAYLKVVASVRRVAEPIGTTLLWIAVEFAYNPAQAIWKRLSLLSHTFLQTAKIYFQELAKDAADLGRLLLRLGLWIWSHALEPGVQRFYSLCEMVARKLAQFGPWLAYRTYTLLLRPVVTSAVEGFRIVLSHPTLLAGLGALSSRIKESVSKGLERLESVNWLVLLETVLTTAISSAYHYTVLVLQLLGQGIKVFAMDIVPNAYADLMMALEVARPVVAWIIDRFLSVAQPVWHAVSWLSLAVFVATRACLAWAHLRIAVPVKELWDSRIAPAVAIVLTTAVAHTKALSSLILQCGFAIAAAMGPVWEVIVKLTQVLQELLIKSGAMVVQLSGGLGERVQEHITRLGPQFQAFKEQAGQTMDDVVLATSNFMMDWVKNEKRE